MRRRPQTDCSLSTSEHHEPLFTTKAHKRILRAALVAFSVAAGWSCRDAVSAWGSPAATARSNADSTLLAFQRRFTDVTRDAAFARSRPILGHYALIPARLHRDSSLWTSTNAYDSARTLGLSASWDGRRYLFRTAESPNYPSKLGEQRHLMRLRRVSGSTYEWVSIVDHAIGPVRVSDFGTAFNALFVSFAGRRGPELRDHTRAFFPRSSRSLGRLLAIDSLDSTPLTDGSTSLALYLDVRPDTLARTLPAFAAYVEKYVDPSILRVEVRDASNRAYLQFQLANGKAQLRARSRGANLVALGGAPTPLPDTLLMQVDFSTKFKIFRVGFDKLIADLTIERDTHERALRFRFRREPEWRLPLAVDKLIKTPLRAPFSGRGAELHLSVRDDLGPVTMSIRRGRITVTESAIMRWLGGLGAAAFGDYEGVTEAEENRFLAELLAALRADIAALTP